MITGENIPFYLGYEADDVIIKSDKKDKTIVYIQASNEQCDSQGEVVLRKALEAQAENFLKSGVISWDHLHKIEKHNQYIIGEPLDVQFTDDNKTLVKCKLYEKNDHAKALINNLESGSTRYGASIGGGILSKSQQFWKGAGKKVPVISKILWDETAITHKPVNTGTNGGVTYTKYKEFGKSFMFNTELEKALMAGAGVNPAGFGAGRSLIPEVSRKKEFWVDTFNAINSQEINNFETLTSYLKSKYNATIDEAVDVAKYILSKAGL